MNDTGVPSIASRFRATLDPGSAKIALTFAETDYTWAELAEFGRNLTDVLDSAEIVPQTSVALIARNSPASVAAILEIMSRSHRLALVDPLQPGEGLALILEELKVDAIVLSELDWSPELENAAEEIDATVILIQDLQAPPTLRRRAQHNARLLDSSELGVEIATSGTTGKPKRILYGYASCAATARDACIATRAMLPPGISPVGWPIIQIFPIAHVGGFYYVLQMGWEGQHQVLLEKFSVQPWVAAVERFHPPLLWVHPPGIRMILEADIAPASLSGARGLRTGSAPLEAETRRAFTERFNVPIIGYFGATEYCGIVTDWSYEEIERFHAERALSVGRPRPGVEMRVIELDGSDRSCEPGRVGRLDIKVERMSDDWFKTNDLARMDSDGFLFLEGRADSVINRGGFKVSCIRVADILRTHPAVGDVLVLGISDERLGEVPAAAIELRPGTTLSHSEITNFARAHLMAYEVPAKFLVSHSLPRASLSKISQKDVRDLLAADRQSA